MHTSSTKTKVTLILLSVALAVACGRHDLVPQVTDAGVPEQKLGASYPFAYPVGPAGGGLSGTYPNPSVTGAPPTGAAGGDLSGTYPNPTVGKIQNNAVTAGALTKGQFLVAGSPSNWAATSLSLDLLESSVTPGAITVIGLQTRAVSSSAPSDTNVLAWNAGLSQWQPTAAGGPPTGTAGGDLSGTYPNPLVASISGVSPILITPASLQWLKATVAPSLSQANQTADIAASSLAINASSAFATAIANTAGGSINIAAGAGATSNATFVGGSVNINAPVGDNAADNGVVNLESAGAMRLRIGQYGLNLGTFSSAATSGTVTLTAAQYVDPEITLTGGALSGALTIVFPNNAGTWHVDLSGISNVTAVNTLTFQSGAATCVTSSINTNSVAVIHSRGSNTIACNIAGAGGGSPTGVAGGDLSGTYPNPTVAKVNGSFIPSGGALTTGNGPYVSGASALTYSALNLGGGAGWVTGVLPAGNQAAQTMGGDVTGTTAASVVSKISGSSPIAVTPNEFQWVAGATGPLLDQVAVASGAGANFTIDPQACTTTGAGGSAIFNVAAPCSGTAESGIKVQRAGTTIATLQPLVSTGASGALYLGTSAAAPTATNYALNANSTNLFLQASNNIEMFLGGTFQWQLASTLIMMTPPTLEWAVGTVNPSMIQVARSSDASVNGLSISAQAAFATATVNNTGGTLALNAGAGAISSATFHGGSVLLNAQVGNSPSNNGKVILESNSSPLVSVGAFGLVLGNAAVATTTGTVTLSAAQYINPLIILNGGALTGALNITFPNSQGTWLVSLGGISGVGVTNTLTFQSGTATCVATAILTTQTLAIVNSNGSNTIDCNF